MTDSIFNDPTDFPTIDPEKDYYAELVGEGKKYKDNLAAGRAIAEKDLFIERLKAETQALREETARQTAELKTRTSLDEFLEKVKNQPARSNVEDPPATQPVALNEEKITEIVKSHLTAKELADRQIANINTVTEGLKKAFGPNYVKSLEEKTEELGLSKEFLDDLAKKSPKAFFTALGIASQTHSVFTPPDSTVNVSGRSQGIVKNYAYYKELKKKLTPAEYYSPALQNEMYEQAKKLGDQF